MRPFSNLLTLALFFQLFTSSLHAQRLEIPRRHEKPPGPPLSAEEAVKKMVVPEGFSVQIVAKEPDVVNPVAMAIDEKGRFWVTESFEYPRREPGPGRDRIKVLEDTDGDGAVDKVTIFAEGLNIPSGIAVGHGGVWVANSPDILFMQDTDGDLKADKIEKVLTGFGRTDTHELPNSLTWGPDGWLYGLNGVFNYCNVKYAEENPNYDENHPGWKFTCAMFRIHPRTREFQIFAEGTSNPWGIAINGDGEFFISACVIDHLWHIVESAYYIRQGGPYPPHTWPMRSIVDHKHQKAAYCGITWFDSPAYPEEYRNVLYMGNIHGGCINADIAERSGATYKGKPHPGFPAPQGAFEYDTVRKRGEGDDAKLADFLTANDAWFMPVVQKVGPDGCLYILDWYDRYHCYQDANADPAGIDRGKGRLYKVVYKGHKNRKADDLGAKSDDELFSLLQSPNVYVRQTSQRLLAERLAKTPDKKIVEQLRSLFLQQPTKDNEHARLRALWVLVSAGLVDEDILAVSEEDPSSIRYWAIRAAGDNLSSDDTFDGWGFLRALEENIQVKLQNIIAISKMKTDESQKASLLFMAVGTGTVDNMVRHVAWQNLVPLLEKNPGAVLEVAASHLIQKNILEDSATQTELFPRIVATACSNPATPVDQLTQLLNVLLTQDSVSTSTKGRVVTAINNAIRARSLSNKQVQSLQVQALELANKAIRLPNQPKEALMIMMALLGDSEAMASVGRTFNDQSASSKARISALGVLVAAKAPNIISNVSDAIGGKSAPKDFRIAVIEAIGGVNDPEVGKFLVDNYPTWEGDVKPRVIEVLTQRDSWSIELLKEIDAKQINKEAINLNQIKRVASFKNEELQALVSKVYGKIRADRRSDRQHVINFHRDFLNGTPGDPHKGALVFKKVCAQCHKMYGEGAEVGPDITRNGRNNWNQLLQNVFDPSAVIGPGYQARQLATSDGRILTGLPVEESEERVVLKIQGGKIETIPRDQIEAYKVSEVSMMPEDLEKQLKPQELADLFAYLALDRPPSDPNAKILSGAPKQKVRE